MSRIIFTSFEALIYLLTIHVILPKKSRLNLKRNVIFYFIIFVSAYFFLKPGLINHLLFHTLLIFSIFTINQVNVYVASITVIINYILILISSLLSILFAIYFLQGQYDYRFILEGDDYMAILLKIVLTAIIVYIYKIFNSLFNRKIKVQKINPRPVMLVNIGYIIFIMAMSMELIEYIPTIYEDVLSIKSLAQLLFTGIFTAYVASIFILYIVNLYLFKSSDYLSIKLSSEIDALTGVLNRKAGMAYLKQRMQSAQAGKHELTLCFIDVNNLKGVNDALGHKVGDSLIKNVATIIKGSLREGDDIARLGGDEFIVIFDKCNIEQAIRAWDRIIERFETFNITTKEPFDISVSVGFSEYNHKMNISSDALIEIADAEMYKNKESYKRLKGKKRNAKW